MSDFEEHEKTDLNSHIITDNSSSSSSCHPRESHHHGEGHVQVVHHGRPNGCVSNEVAWKFFTQAVDSKIQSALEELDSFVRMLGALPIDLERRGTAIVVPVAGGDGLNEEHAVPQDSDVHDASVAFASKVELVEEELRTAQQELREMRKKQSLDLSAASSMRLRDVATIAWNRLHECLRDAGGDSSATHHAYYSHQHEDRSLWPAAKLLSLSSTLRRLVAEVYLTSAHFFSPFSASRENQLTADPRRSLYCSSMCIRVAKDGERLFSLLPAAAQEPLLKDTIEWMRRAQVILDTIAQRYFGSGPLHTIVASSPDACLVASDPQCHQGAVDDALYQKFLTIYRDLVHMRFTVATSACAPQSSVSSLLCPRSGPDAPVPSEMQFTLPAAGIAAIHLERWLLNEGSKLTQHSRNIYCGASWSGFLQICSQFSQLYSSWFTEMMPLACSNGTPMEPSVGLSNGAQKRRLVLIELLGTAASSIFSLLRDASGPRSQPLIDQCLCVAVQMSQLHACNSQWDKVWPVLQNMSELLGGVGTLSTRGGGSDAGCFPHIFVQAFANRLIRRSPQPSDEGHRHMAGLEGEQLDVEATAAVSQARLDFLYLLLLFTSSFETKQSCATQGELCSALLKFPIVSIIGASATRNLLVTQWWGASQGNNDSQSHGQMACGCLQEAVDLWSKRMSVGEDRRTDVKPGCAPSRRMMNENIFVLRDCLLAMLSSRSSTAAETGTSCEERCKVEDIICNCRSLYEQQSELAAVALSSLDDPIIGDGDDDMRVAISTTCRRYLLTLWDLGAKESPIAEENDELALVTSAHEVLLLAAVFLPYGDGDESSRLWRCIAQSCLSASRHRHHVVTCATSACEDWIRRAEDAACKAQQCDGSHPSAATQLLLCDIRLEADDIRGFQAATLSLLQCEPMEDVIDAFHCIASRLAQRIRDEEQRNGNSEEATEPSRLPTPSSSKCLFTGALEQFIQVVLHDVSCPAAQRMPGVFSMVQAYITIVATSQRPAATTPRTDDTNWCVASLSRAAAFLVQQCRGSTEKMTTTQKVWLASLLLEALQDAQQEVDACTNAFTAAGEPPVFNIFDELLGTVDTILADAIKEITLVDDKNATGRDVVSQRSMQQQLYEMNLQAALIRMAHAMRCGEGLLLQHRSSSRGPFALHSKDHLYELLHRCEEPYAMHEQLRALWGDRMVTSTALSCDQAGLPSSGCTQLSQPQGNLQRVPALLMLFKSHLALWECVDPAHQVGASFAGHMQSAVERFCQLLIALVHCDAVSLLDLECLDNSPALQDFLSDTPTKARLDSCNVDAHAEAGSEVPCSTTGIATNVGILSQRRRLRFATSQAILVKQVFMHQQQRTSEDEAVSISKMFVALARSVACAIGRQDQIAMVFVVLHALGVVHLVAEEDDSCPDGLLHFFPFEAQRTYQVHSSDILCSAWMDARRCLATFKIPSILTHSVIPSLTRQDEAFDLKRRVAGPTDLDHDRAVEFVVVELWNQYCTMLWSSMADEDSRCCPLQPPSPSDNLEVWRAMVSTFASMLPRTSGIRVSIERQIGSFDPKP